MVRKLLFIVLVLFLVLSTTTVVLAEKPPEDDNPGNQYGVGKDNGFDESGYNSTAHIFIGTYGEWCTEKIGDEDYCQATYGDWWDDKLIMKWNAEWDLGNAENWTGDDYDARLSNLGNGRLPGGSGEMYHAKIVWVGPCSEGAELENGGYCIWGEFAVIMEKSHLDGENRWWAHGIPTGFGVNLHKPE